MEDTPTSEYLKGFNQGYLLEKEEPGLSEVLVKSLATNSLERAKGFVAGREEYLQEKTKDKLPAWLKDNRLREIDKESNGKNKDLDKDK